MKGIVFDGEELRVVEGLELRDPGPGEVIVRIANSGVCHKKRCKLPHVDRAGQIRKAAAAAAKTEREDESDPSSEDEEYDAIDSDDVDSDEFDDEPELIGGEDSGEMSQQQDFIHF